MNGSIEASNSTLLDFSVINRQSVERHGIAVLNSKDVTLKR